MILLALLCFSVAVYLFILFIVKRDRGHKEPLGALFAAAGFGFGAVILAGFLNDWLLPKQVAESIAATTRAPVSSGTILAATIGVGIIEEGLKNLPLAFFIYKKRYFDEMTDGIIYFGLSGLAFGIFEDFTYALQFGGGVGLSRIITEPYLHSAFCIIFGTALIHKKLLRRSWALPIAGFAGAVLAHGIFDYLGLTKIWYNNLVMLGMAIALNIGLFVLFRRSQILDERRGQSAIGDNKFCRRCGRPNPERLLYCSYCGKLS